MQQQNKYMELALKEAYKCLKNDDVPVGCVIVRNDEIIAKAYNRRKKDKNTLKHCELIAIDRACKIVGDWRLEDCTMYVTMEPCQMCAGAILQARLKKIVIGTRNYKSGCCGSVINLLNYEGFNHIVDIEYDVMSYECSSIVKEFFEKLRYNDKRYNII